MLFIAYAVKGNKTDLTVKGYGAILTTDYAVM